MPDFPWLEELIKESERTDTLICDRTLRYRGLFEPLTKDEAENPEN